MSLINEALKKAQSQQNPDKSAARNAGTGSTVAQAMERGSPQPGTPPPLSANGQSLLVPVLTGGAILAVLVFGVGLTLWSLNRPAETVSDVARAEAPAPPPPAPGEAEPAAEPAAAADVQPAQPAPPPVPATLPVADEPAFAVEPAPPLEQPAPRAPAPESPALPLDEPAPTPPAPASEAARSADAAPTEPEPSPAPQAVEEPAPAAEATRSAEPAPVPEAEIRERIGQLEIRGIMADSRRVLIYDSRVKRSFAFGLDSTVSQNPFLKIKDITSSSILFTDDAGRSFTKTF